MKIFTFQAYYDAPITYQFDQDDIKTVGKRRTHSEAVVVAPDKELAEFFLRRHLAHYDLVIGTCREQEINVFVDSSARTIVPIPLGKPIGPEVIDDKWKERIEMDRKSWR